MSSHIIVNGELVRPYADTYFVDVLQYILAVTSTLPNEVCVSMRLPETLEQIEDRFRCDAADITIAQVSDTSAWTVSLLLGMLVSLGFRVEQTTGINFQSWQRQQKIDSFL